MTAPWVPIPRVRKLRWRCRRFGSWARWVRAGRPTDIPLVARVGRLRIKADGTKVCEGFGFDATYYAGRPMQPDTMWTYLATRYPVEIEPDPTLLDTQRLIGGFRTNEGPDE